MAWPEGDSGGFAAAAAMRLAQLGQGYLCLVYFVRFQRKISRRSSQPARSRTNRHATDRMIHIKSFAVFNSSLCRIQASREREKLVSRG